MEKRRVVYHVTTTTKADLAIWSFPLGEDEEWYLGAQKTAYLCVQSDQLNDKQISWLTTSAQVAAWKYLFDLTPMLEGR